MYIPLLIVSVASNIFVFPSTFDTFTSSYFAYKLDSVSIVNEATALYTFTSVPTLFAYVTFIPAGIASISAVSFIDISTDFSWPSYFTVLLLNSTSFVRSYIPLLIVNVASNMFVFPSTFDTFTSFYFVYKSDAVSIVNIAAAL